MSRRPGRPSIFLLGKPMPGDTYWAFTYRMMAAKLRMKSWKDYRTHPPAWIAMKEAGDEDWILFRAADLSMALLDRTPPDVYNSLPKRRDWLSLDEEIVQFIPWLRAELVKNERRARGPQPDFTKTAKTALALVLARKIVAGLRHYSKPPTNREIEQAWWLLFDEREPHDSIKSRRIPVARLCAMFAADASPRTPARTRESFRKAGDAVLRKLTPKPAQAPGEPH